LILTGKSKNEKKEGIKLRTKKRELRMKRMQNAIMK